MLSRILDLVFPPKCLVCNCRGSVLCVACHGELPYLPNGLCWRCATLLIPGGACRGCRHLSPALAWIRAPFTYEGAARRAVLTLKFRSGRYVAQTMGELLRAALMKPRVSADLVVPVPLSRQRLRERGFNQAELLAAHVTSAVGGVLQPDLLSRLDRRPQQTLTAAHRLANLRGAFSCPRPGDVRGKRVLLVDDVITTGATASACADTLTQAGAERVFVLAFARDL